MNCRCFLFPGGKDTAQQIISQELFPDFYNKNPALCPFRSRKGAQSRRMNEEVLCVRLIYLNNLRFALGQDSISKPLEEWTKVRYGFGSCPAQS